MSQSTTQGIAQMIKQAQNIDEVASYLDQLNLQDRVQASRSLNARAQKKLWVLCQNRQVSREDLVPVGREGQSVRHLGRNTLPVFKFFEKRFYAPQAESQELWGYNEGVTRPWIGPGYFVARDCRVDEPEAFVIDYEQVPSEHPLPQWPQVKSNEKGLSRLVYAYMQDYLRKVSDGVLIGKAYRKGKETENYFTLCRWDEE